MIDSPSAIMFVSITKKIPESVLHFFGIFHTIDINKATGDSFFIGLSGIDMKIRVVYIFLRIIHINFFRCTVKISQPDNRILLLKIFIEIFAKPGKPLQFVLELF